MLGSVSAADWVQSEGWREGLFSQCVKAGAPTPLPFGGDATPGCRKAHSAGYVRGAAALAIICLITDFFGTLLVGLRLRSTDPNKKYKYYRVAVYSLFTVAVLALFLAVIIYPTSVSKEMAEGKSYFAMFLYILTYNTSLRCLVLVASICCVHLLKDHFRINIY